MDWAESKRRCVVADVDDLRETLEALAERLSDVLERL